MEFIVNSTSLSRCLQRIVGAVPQKSMLPIIENFLFDINNNVLLVSATNLETSMQISIPVESKIGSEKTLVAVPVKVLMDTLKNIPEQPLTVMVSDNFGISIFTQSGKYKISGEDGSNFPPIPTYESADQLNMSAETLIRAINKVLFAASDDEDRAALNGMLFNVESDKITFVSTDAHRLSKYVRTDVGSQPAKFTVPKKALLLIKNSIDSNVAEMRIMYNENNAFFVTDTLTLVCRLIDQKYPNYENVIPRDNPKIVSISKSEFLASLKRMNIFANKVSHQVKLDISKDKVELSTEDFDYANEAKETLHCIYEGEELVIGFNASLLLEVVSNIETQNVNIHLSLPNRAALILPDTQLVNEDILMLAMPILLNNL